MNLYRLSFTQDELESLEWAIEKFENAYANEMPFNVKLLAKTRKRIISALDSPWED